MDKFKNRFTTKKPFIVQKVYARDGKLEFI